MKADSRQPGDHVIDSGGGIPQPYGAYSHAIVAGDFVFVAGQIARDSMSGRPIDGDVAAQTGRCLAIIAEILAEHRLTLDHVVRATVYLANIDDFPAMNEVFGAVFRPPYPARSTPEVKLPHGALVGIEVTAYSRGPRA